MDDAAALRLTLRRCTAVLVVALGMIVANTDPYDPSSSLGYPLAYLALGYLAASLLAGLFRRPDGPSDTGDVGTDADGPDTGDEGDSDDGESGNDERSGNDGESDDGDEHPPVEAYSRPW